MSDKSAIEWTDATWNPTTGCTKVSPGCLHCYAETMDKRLVARNEGVRYVPWTAYAQQREDTARAGDGTYRAVRLHPERLDQPLKWKRPRRIFVNSMSDLFHEDVPDAFIDRVFAAMALTPWHTYQVLTKRPERMRAYLSDQWTGFRQREQMSALRPDLAVIDVIYPLPNVWLGVSAENQRWADARLPLLAQVPAAVRFVSCEPLLGPLDLREWLCQDGMDCRKSPWLLTHYCPDNKMDWLIVGGESGPGARPMHPDWARSLRDQCQEAGVPYFFKQWGEWAPDYQRGGSGVPTSQRRYVDCFGAFRSTNELTNFSIPDDWYFMARVGRHAAGALLDGREWREFPQEAGHDPR